LYEIVFFLVKDNNILPCLHTIRLSYNIYKYVSALSINAYVYMKHETRHILLLKVMKIPTQKGEHSCRYTELPI